MYSLRALVALCVLPSCFSPTSDEGVDASGSTGSEDTTEAADTSSGDEPEPQPSSSSTVDEGTDESEGSSTGGETEGTSTGEGSTSTGEGTVEDPANCNEAKIQDPASADGIYLVDPDGSDGPAAPFDVYCDMTTEGGGWTSLVHLTTLDQLRFDLPHEEVAVSQGTSFWILGEQASASYTVVAYLGIEATEYRVGAATPMETGWTWNGVTFPNPEGCHAGQNVYLVSSEGDYPRSLGNPHFEPGESLPSDVLAAASFTRSTIDVARVANYPAVHIGCIGGNVLQDPIVWVR